MAPLHSPGRQPRPVEHARRRTFRCGQYIAFYNMSIEELLEKCGKRRSRSSRSTSIGPTRGAGNLERGTITVEKWTYDHSSQAAAMIVTIKDKIKWIDGEVDRPHAARHRDRSTSKRSMTARRRSHA